MIFFQASVRTKEGAKFWTGIHVVPDEAKMVDVIAALQHRHQAVRIEALQFIDASAVSGAMVSALVAP